MSDGSDLGEYLYETVVEQAEREQEERRQAEKEERENSRNDD